MKRCVIFGAAEFDRLAAPVEPEDLVIAADGGLVHTKALGLDPAVILGDFDSLGYVPEDARVYPVAKDDTDAMLAIRLGLDWGCREFWLYGCLDGPRLDHTMGNFQALAFLASRGAVGYLIGSAYIATVFCRERAVFSPAARGILSLFCLGPQVPVRLEGLAFPYDGLFYPEVPLGVSNEFTGQAATITVGDGLLLALWDRAVGVPDRQPEK